MPLIKSSSESAFKKNVAEMRRAGHPEAQALAASYRNQRVSKTHGLAKGGVAPVPGSGIQETLPGGGLNPALPGAMSPKLPGGGGAFQVHEHGLISGPGTGRSDSIHMRVPKGGYMIPADIVSGIGHGNSLAGAAALDHSFPRNIRTPEGRAHVRGFAPLMQHPFNMAFGTKKFAVGGAQAEDDGMADIMGSAGEYFVHPEAIVGRYGSLKFGHKALDHWVQMRRKQNIREQRKLKPPKGSKKI